MLLLYNYNCTEAFYPCKDLHKYILSRMSPLQVDILFYGKARVGTQLNIYKSFTLAVFTVTITTNNMLHNIF